MLFLGPIHKIIVTLGKGLEVAVVVAQVEAHETMDQEVAGLIPPRSWVFSLLYSILSEVCP